jgi:hypothetical protein
MRSELEALEMSELRRRAVAKGIEPDAIKMTGDADDPKEAVLQPAATAAAAIAVDTEQLMSLKMSDLRIVGAGVDKAAIDEADDSSNPKEAMVVLLVAVLAVDDDGGRLAQLVRELEQLNMSALRQRAFAAGIAEAEIDEADDAPESKLALIALLLASIPVRSKGKAVSKLN